MTMRMQDLVERAALPRTTIHHYIREDLLPPALKSARNAARYGEEHLERLRLIARLRDEEGEALSIPQIRRVIAHLGAGADLRDAVRLVREAVGTPPAPGGWGDVDSFTDDADVDSGFVATLIEGGLLDDPARDRLTVGDLLVARACEAVSEAGVLEPRDLRPLADLMAEVGNYSDILVEVQASREGEGTEQADRSADLRRRLSQLCEALLWRAFSTHASG